MKHDPTWAAYLLAMILLAGTGLARAEPCRLGLSAQLPLQPGTGLIEAQFNHQPALLMLDTGAFSTVLTPDAVKRLRLHADLDKSQSFRGMPDSALPLYGFGGERIVRVVMARDFDLGGMHASPFHVMMAELDIPGIDGLLSVDLLQKYDIDLDFAGGQVRIFTAYGACGRPAALLQPPLYVVPLTVTEDDPLPRVHVDIDGHRFAAQIDTGASSTAINMHALSELGVPPQALAGDRHIKIRGIGPNRVDGTVHVFHALSIGDLTLTNIPIVIMNSERIDQVDVVLGRDVQRRMHFWISNSAHALVIQYPPLPSPLIK